MEQQEAGSIIFVHPPKTAGSTLSRVMYWEYEPSRICNIDNRFYYWSTERVKQWSVARLARMQVFQGHMPFGLHQYIPQPCTYITVLRDPIDRTISEYYAQRYGRRHPFVYRYAKRMTLEEYVRNVPHHNPQTKALAGAGVSHPYHFYTAVSSYHIYAGPCAARTLEIAKENLCRSFSLVGITERFEETLALGKILFGWKMPAYVAVRQARKRPRKEEVSPGLRDLIAERHQFDMELYRFGVALFERALSRNAEHLPEELLAVRRARGIKGLRRVYYRSASRVLHYLVRARCAI